VLVVGDKETTAEHEGYAFDLAAWPPVQLLNLPPLDERGFSNHGV
jgi:hypothetical protein